MILSESLVSIGKIFKPHGIKGELSAVFDSGFEPDDVRCIVLDIDGIYVPFFIEASRQRGSESFLIKIDGIDDETAASALNNHEIFALADELPQDENDADGVYLYALEGYELLDRGTPIGTIEHIDDSTDNILLHVSCPDGSTVLIPFVEDFISALDTEAHTIEMELPEGIIDLNK